MDKATHPGRAGLIDLHTHILPGLDDGAPTVDVAVALARKAAERGVVRMVATPHTNITGAADGETRLTTVRIDQEVAWLQRELDGQGVPVTIVAGCECWSGRWREVLREALPGPTIFWWSCQHFRFRTT
jgi:tyrosine-protein phosphatase YwqE